ncbi:fasciclin-2-like isoform X2 [Tachypleus tridentatus]|uniref:fasciclin-2-like isoform X2 n=1 Tax=Tachypleus tridentatus TaxID=6853 RepID=UPI003FD4A447
MWNCIITIVLLSTQLLGCYAQNPENRLKLSIQPVGSSQTRPAGESFAVTCTGESYDNSLFSDMRWEDPNGEVLGQGGSYNNMEINMIKNSIVSLVFVTPETENTGQYTCRATYNDTKTLESGVRITFFRDITWNDCLDKQSLIVNQPGELKCVISANPYPQVAWTKLDETDTVSLDESRFKVGKSGVLISKVLEDDHGKYRIQAIVTETGRFKHKDIVLEVLIPPNITDYQNEVQAVENEEIVLYCKAEISYPEPVYHWLDENGVTLDSKERFVVHEVNGSLTIHNLKKEDAGNYTCVARNKVGEDNRKVQLIVFSKPEIIQFENKTALEETKGLLECRASGVPAPQLTILKERQQIQYVDKISIEKFQEEDVAVLTMTINKASRDDDAEYLCLAKNIAGSVEKTGHLLVESKPKVIGPKSEIVKTWNNNPVNLTCIIDSFPVVTFKWSFNGLEIVSNQNETYSIFVNEGHSNLLVKPSPETEVFGSYTCEGINKHGSDRSVIQLEEATVPGKLLQVKYENTTTTTVSFEFLDPKYDGGLPILAYVVEYRKENESQEEAKVNYWTAGSHYTLENLKPSVTYAMRFAAKNAVGLGTWTEENLQTMPSDSAPVPPIISPSENLSTYPDKIDIKWKIISEDNGRPIELLQLRYFKVDKTVEENQWKQFGSEKVINIENDWQNGHYTITGLESNSNYKVELRAKNEIGFSNVDTMIFQTSQAKGNDSDQEEPMNQDGKVPTAGIVAVVVVLILLILVIIDVTCYKCYHCGAFYFLRNNTCGKSSEDKETINLENGSKNELVQKTMENPKNSNDGEVTSENTLMIDPSHGKDITREKNDLKASKRSNTNLSKNSEV